ncbi:MAG: NUDIX domain-containing protein [Chloroflexi bacterium]|nr:NUDIX domain-containing protein [Chloroflexota bacterium]
MKLLATIYRQKDANPEGKTFLREAVRGVIFREGKLLMVYSTVNGDYKFPGGGIDAGETHLEALRRELNEECGATLKEVIGELGKTIEYAHAIEDKFDTYRQNSYYYFCEINGNLGNLNLEDYEEDLGFRPEWIDVETALEANKNILDKSTPAPRWTKREVFVLAHILSTKSFA